MLARNEKKIQKEKDKSKLKSAQVRATKPKREENQKNVSS